jgi:multidrug efflux pump subunit AcrA (membrane-fusion protein)
MNHQSVRNKLAFMLPGILAVMVLCLAAGGVHGKEAQKAPALPPEAASSRIILSGKLFCPLKHSVAMPFPGQITGLKVKVGQPVQAGEELAQYRLSPEALLHIRRRLSPPRLQELAVKLAEVEAGLAEVQGELTGLRRLAQEQLASAERLRQAESRRQSLLKQQDALQAGLQSERRMAADELAVVRQQLGKSVTPDRLPQEASLLSPLKGHVIWMHPGLQGGTELNAATPVFVVGALHPMIIRTRVHEIEALQLKVGDRAEVSLESLPGRAFEAKLTALPWTSATPDLDQPAYFDVEFTVANPDLLLKEGLKAQVVLDKNR